MNQYLRNTSIGTTVIKGIWQYKLSLSYLKKAFKMIYKLLLQLFRILLGFRNNIHLMYALEGNSEFCFPENLNVSRDEVEGNIEIRGKTKFTISRGSIH